MFKLIEGRQGADSFHPPRPVARDEGRGTRRSRRAHQAIPGTQVQTMVINGEAISIRRYGSNTTTSNHQERQIQGADGPTVRGGRLAHSSFAAHGQY
jgi:hypothetical protein